MSTITIDRSVVELALEALDAAISGGKYPYKHRCSEAIDKLSTALEQPQVEQEPVELRHLRVLNQELLEALEKISAIENQEYGADWEEIEEARDIADAAIAKATGETK